MKAIAPNGLEITGTLETLRGRAGVIFHAEPREEQEGHLCFSWDGGTDVFWDEQKTATNEKGQRIFLDEEGNQWTEAEITLEEVAGG